MVDPGVRCDPPYTGRSLPLGQRNVQLWASFLPVDGDYASYADPSDGAQFFRDCRYGGPGFHQITTTVISYIRNVGEVPTGPLPQTAFSQPPAGLNFTRRTQFQLRVVASDGVDTRQFDMDANQSISIVAQDVCIEWLGPSGALDLTNTNAAAPTRTGVVEDCFLGVNISRIEAAPGDNSTAVLTRHLYVPENEQRSIAIPPYATEVTIYQEPVLGGAATQWSQTIGDLNSAAGGLSVASLPFIAGRRTQPTPVGNCTHLRSDLDAAERFFTLVWTIRP